MKQVQRLLKFDNGAGLFCVCIMSFPCSDRGLKTRQSQHFTVTEGFITALELHNSNAMGQPGRRRDLIRQTDDERSLPDCATRIPPALTGRTALCCQPGGFLLLPGTVSPTPSLD